MTVQEMFDWCIDKQRNRKIILLTENRELEYSDIGLLFTKEKAIIQNDLFKEIQCSQKKK